jgi:hypothetical protein
LTDLEPEQAQIAWYRLRTWIEGGFKDFKRGFWGWHHSKMERASCVERLWLAMSLAQLWCVSLGCQAEAQDAERVRLQEPGALLPATHIARKKRARPCGQLPPRRLSCVLRGHLLLLAMQFQGQPFSACHLAHRRLARGDDSSTKTRNQQEKAHQNFQGERAPTTGQTSSAGSFPCSKVKNLYL